MITLNIYWTDVNEIRKSFDNFLLWNGNTYRTNNICPRYPAYGRHLILHITFVQTTVAITTKIWYKIIARQISTNKANNVFFIFPICRKYLMKITICLITRAAPMETLLWLKSTHGRKQIFPKKNGKHLSVSSEYK